jgi:hypothetical protein
MSHSKQALGGWLLLFAVFLAGASAGSLGGLLCWRLNDWRGLNVKCQQSMGANQAGYQISGEQENRKSQRLSCFQGDIVALSVNLHSAGFEAYPDRRIAEVDGFWADHGERGVQAVRVQLEYIADSYRDFAVLIAEDHHTPSRFSIAFVFRRFHIFQNQSTSIVEYSCLRDARKGTSDTRSSSKSSPSTMVLKSTAHFRFPVAPTLAANASGAC